MSSRMLTEIPYCADSTTLFAPLANWPWAVFLDSGRPFVERGRYDIIAADPLLTLTTHGSVTEIRDSGGVRVSQGDPFELLRRHIGERSETIPGLPFSGGALGYFSYDLGRRIEKLPRNAKDAEHIPEMAVGIYDWALLVDHEQRRSYLVSQGRDKRTALMWPKLLRFFENPKPASVQLPFQAISAPQSNMSFSDYAKAFRRIKHYIREGDCYQVNLAQRFEARVHGSLWQAYCILREFNPAPFAAYINTPFCQVLSSSPERFLKVAGGVVETKPIKGTRPRSIHPQEDLWLAEELRHSEKDRAENVMIVDLLRNDLGKVCEYGSVSVSKLFNIESYATVHHLVSTVSGSLATDRDAIDLLRACFPGGSITGAPKLRAMEIIEEVEPNRRGVYCGSIGYIGFDGSMDTNIAIRTLVHSGGRMRCWGGGGIVADSELEAEYQETFDKVSALLKLMEKMRSAYVGREARRQSCHR